MPRPNPKPDQPAAAREADRIVAASGTNGAAPGPPAEPLARLGVADGNALRKRLDHFRSAGHSEERPTPAPETEALSRTTLTLRRDDNPGIREKKNVAFSPFRRLIRRDFGVLAAFGVAATLVVLLFVPEVRPVVTSIKLW